jgi:hypothetical protein
MTGLDDTPEPLGTDLKEKLSKIIDESSAAPRLRRAYRGFGFIILALILAFAGTAYALLEIRRVQTVNAQTLHAVEDLTEHIQSCITLQGKCYQQAAALRSQTADALAKVMDARISAAVQNVLDQQAKQAAMIEGELGTIRKILRTLGSTIPTASPAPIPSNPPSRPMPTPTLTPSSTPMPSSSPSPPPTIPSPSPPVGLPVITQSAQELARGITCFVLQLC